MLSFSKKLFFVLIFSFIIREEKAFCQNLVPNPSFEDTVSCPTTANQLDKAKHWHVSRGSPDYFNECDWITGSTAVPSNFCGYQYANDGVAYCGFAAFGLNGLNTREFFSCQLLNPLTIGKKYLISFYVSLAGGIGKQIPCNKIGTLFSTQNYNLLANAPIGNYAQFYSDSIVSDTLNWVLIEGSFIADSAYSYMSVGNFFDDFNTDTIYSIASSYSYYFIDNIKVFEDSTTDIHELYFNEKCKIFPNPVDDFLRVESTSAGKIDKIEIVDIRGKMTFEFYNVTSSNQMILGLKKLNSGCYYIKIYFINSKPMYHLIIKL